MKKTTWKVVVDFINAHVDEKITRKQLIDEFKVDNEYLKEMYAHTVDHYRNMLSWNGYLSKPDGSGVYTVFEKIPNWMTSSRLRFEYDRKIALGKIRNIGANRTADI